MLDVLPAATQDRHRQFAGDGREGFEEVVQRQIVGEVVEERLHRDARALEDRRPAEDVGVNGDQVCWLHEFNIGYLRPLVKLRSLLPELASASPAALAFGLLLRKLLPARIPGAWGATRRAGLEPRYFPLPFHSLPSGFN